MSRWLLTLAAWTLLRAWLRVNGRWWCTGRWSAALVTYAGCIALIGVPFTETAAIWAPRLCCCCWCCCCSCCCDWGWLAAIWLAMEVGVRFDKKFNVLGGGPSAWTWEDRRAISIRDGKGWESGMIEHKRKGESKILSLEGLNEGMVKSN